MRFSEPAPPPPVTSPCRRPNKNALSVDGAHPSAHNARPLARVSAQLGTAGEPCAKRRAKRDPSAVALPAAPDRWEGASRRPPSRLSRLAQRPVGAGPHGHQKPGTFYGLDSQRAALPARWSRQVRARKGRAPVADQPPRKTSPLAGSPRCEKAPVLTTASPTPELALCVQGRKPPAWRRTITHSAVLR